MSGHRSARHGAMHGAVHGAAPFEQHGATSGNLRGAQLTTPDPSRPFLAPAWSSNLEVSLAWSAYPNVPLVNCCCSMRSERNLPNQTGADFVGRVSVRANGAVG